MRSLTIASVALLVLFAGVGLANASTVTFTIDFADTQLSTDGTSGPTSTTYTVYAQVTDNTTSDGLGGSLDGGLWNFQVNTEYTGTGSIKHNKAIPALPAAVDATAATTAVAPFTTLPVKGTLNPATDPDPGTAGVLGTAGASDLPASKFDYYIDPAPFQLGNGSPVAIFTGAVTALADGVVNVTVGDTGIGNTNVFAIKGDGLYVTPADTLVPATATLNVGAPIGNTPPTATIDTLGVGEGDWTGPGGWNNPARQVAIAATTGDQDGDPLTYTWEITAPASAGGLSYDLGQNVEDLTLTIQMLLDAGVPLPADGSMVTTHPENYIYSLALTASDGTDETTSNAIDVFVPEPATIGLLGFGVIGLLRRRRRA